MNQDASWTAQDRGPYRLLVVEDEPLMRSIIVQLARSEGYEVMEAPAAEIALHIFEKEKIDLAILDLNLTSGGSGLDLLPKMRELDAPSIHFSSERANNRSLPINCGALPENLLESELFGYKRGAFTGAGQDKVGLLKAADKGTILLDEIGELPLALQVKLLRALQEREAYPLGANDPVAFDVRVLCATNKNLDNEVNAGRFPEH